MSLALSYDKYDSLFFKEVFLMTIFSKHYFVCANSAKGFQNFFPSNLKSLNKIYILKGGPGTGKSSLMKKIGTALEEKEYSVEYIHCSSDPDSLDGLICRTLSIGIVDGTSPHVVEPTAPGAIEEYINLGIAWNIEELSKHKKEILYLQEEIAACYPKAYEKFAEALAIHDEWEKIYIDHMNFKKANVLTQEVISEILGATQLSKRSTIMHRFFGGSTPKGAFDFVPDLIEPMKKRYFIKGRPGSGKSTLLKKLLATAQLRGLDVEVYHCGFDPDSLDMLIIPELEVCIFDSTSPHEYFPKREDDHTIDMYKQLISPDTDLTYEKELAHISKRYKFCVKEGLSHLTYAKMLHDDLEKYYIDATDFTILDDIYTHLMKHITSRILPLK